MLQTISDVDKKVSRPIIEADNPIVSIILYPFAAFFHPRLIFLAYFSVFYFSAKNIHITGIYSIGTGICFLTIFFLKKIIKR